VKHPVAICVAAVLAAGCSTASKDITASYVSPLPYANYSCEQLAAEGGRIQTRAAQLAGRLDKAADNDKAIVAVSAVLFWPAIFFIGGTKEQEAEYARLKGEHDAVQSMSIEKNCGATTTASVPSAPAAPSTTSVQPAATGGTQQPEKTQLF